MPGMRIGCGECKLEIRMTQQGQTVVLSRCAACGATIAHDDCRIRHDVKHEVAAGLISPELADVVTEARIARGQVEGLDNELEAFMEETKRRGLRR